MRDFERYAPAIGMFHAGSAAVSLSFGVVVLRGGSPVTPELYGPDVYAVPALCWAAVQLTGALCAIFGAAIGHRAGAWLCLFGSVISALLFSAFSVMASNAGAPGTLLLSGCAFVMAPASAASGLLALSHLRGRDGQ